MRPVFYVKETEAGFAREMERRLLELPEVSGVLFAGVSVTPETPESPPIYNVWIGCSRVFDERMFPSLVQNVFREEIARGLQVKVEVHAGCSRPRKTLDTVS